MNLSGLANTILNRNLTHFSHLQTTGGPYKKRKLPNNLSTC